MELIDDYISKDIKKISEFKDIPWMKPIIHIHPKEPNPFLQEDFQDLNESQSVIDSDIGRLFCVPGCEMEINFPEEFENTAQSLTSSMKTTGETLRSIAKAFNRSSIAQTKEINKTYATGIKTPKNQINVNQHITPLTKNVTISLTSLSPNVVDVKMIEPIICSLFIYSGKEKKIISDYWNFVPPSSLPFFESAKIHTKSSETATFIVDPRIMNDNPYFILLLSHPLLFENSASVNKYYLCPTPQTEQSAIKKIRDTFPKISNCFSTFACSFLPFTRGDFQMPMPYLLDGPLPEKEIHDFINEAAKKYKQIPFSIFFKGEESPGESPLYIRPIYRIFVQPQLCPIHDMIVRIDSLSLSHKMNVIVSVSLIDGDQNKFICLKSKLVSIGYVNEVFSRCSYKSRNPVFDDSFLIKLPQPVLPTMALQFQIWHAHLKTPEKGVSLIGTATVPLYKAKNGLFIENGEHSVHPTLEGATKPDKSFKITFSIFLRSNLVINDKKFFLFSTNKGKMAPVDTLSEQMVVTNLMFILTRILKSFIYERDISFLPFIHVRDNSLKVTESFKFEKYLNIFVRYFAFKEYSPKRGVDANENIDIDLTVGNNRSSIGLTKNSPLSQSTTSISSIYSMNSDSSNISPSESPLSLFPPIQMESPHSLTNPQIAPKTLSAIPEVPFPHDTEAPINLQKHPVRSTRKSVFRPQSATTSTGSIEKSLHNSSSWFELNKIPTIPNEVKSTGPADTANVSNISLIDFCEINKKKNESIPIYVKLITCFARTIEANGLKYMKHLVDFVFSLIVKAFAMASKVEFLQEIDTFVRIFAKKVREDIVNVKRYSKSIGLFSNLLFDIRLSMMATKVSRIYLSEFLSTPETYGVAVQYINYAFRPSLFYFSLKYISDFKMSLLRIIEIAFNNETLYGIFGIIIQLLSCYDEEMSCIAASALLPCITKVRPNQLSSKTTEIVTHLTFLNFLLEHASTDALKTFCSSNDNLQNIFKLCHFLLIRTGPEELTQARKQLIQRIETINDITDEKVQQIKLQAKPRRETVKMKGGTQPKILPIEALSTNTIKTASVPSVGEILNSTVQSIIKFAFKFMTVADMNGAFKLMTLCFHLMNIKGYDDTNFKCIMDFLSDLFLKFSPDIFNSTQPCIVRVIGRLFDFVIDKRDQAEIIKPIKALFKADFETSNSHDIADAFCTRSLAMMKYDNFANPLVISFMDNFGHFSITNNFYDTFFNLEGVSSKLKDPRVSAELRQDYIFFQFTKLRDSPDSQFESLKSLYDLHAKTQNYHEMINVLVLQAALILEVLTVNGKISPYFNIDHPTQLLQKEYPIVSLVETTKVLDVPSFADSLYFNEYGIFSLLYKAISICSESKLYDRAIFIIDLIWPMLERLRLYEQLGGLFSNFEVIFTSALNTPKVTNPYFKVSLFGTAFLRENGRTFIYRAKELTNLFEFADSITNKYKKISPESIFELISDSDIVDVNTLDPSKNYIQVTFAEPYKPENGSIISEKFFFDRPFVPGEKKKQGNITNQWIARTICTTRYALPSIITRSIVDDIVTRQYPPIVNAYRMIRKRTESMEAALEAKDTRQVQQLLHGSLIVTVNEGPEKIAEAFLVGEDTKEKQKLRLEFNKMLKVLRIGVKFHGEWVTNNNEFVPLQVQLEDGLSELTAKLDKIDHSLVK